MNKYLLDNYCLSGGQFARSLLISEYGLRHLERADAKPKYAFGHRLLAAIEIIPVIGLIISIAELLFRAIYLAFRPVIQPNSWIFYGTQARCNGTYGADKALDTVSRLNKSAVAGVHFNATKLTGRVEGGTCTAMALKFVRKYLQVKKRVDLSPQRLLEKMRRKGAYFEKSSLAFRATQAALNTIEIDVSLQDPSRSKLESLIRWKGLQVSWSSPCYLLNNQGCFVQGESPLGELARKIEGFAEGIYFIRAIEPATNEKLEAHGHTLVFIKEAGLHLFYDANEGLMYSDAQEAGSLVERQLRHCVNLFQTTDVRFYRVESGLA